jgi:hypothetical protein
VAGSGAGLLVPFVLNFTARDQVSVITDPVQGVKITTPTAGNWFPYNGPYASPMTNTLDFDYVNPFTITWDPLPGAYGYVVVAKNDVDETRCALVKCKATPWTLVSGAGVLSASTLSYSVNLGGGLAGAFDVLDDDGIQTPFAFGGKVAIAVLPINAEEIPGPIPVATMEIGGSDAVSGLPTSGWGLFSAPSVAGQIILKDIAMNTPTTTQAANFSGVWNVGSEGYNNVGGCPANPPLGSNVLISGTYTINFGEYMDTTLPPTMSFIGGTPTGVSITNAKWSSLSGYSFNIEVTPCQSASTRTLRIDYSNCRDTSGNRPMDYAFTLPSSPLGTYRIDYIIP